MNSLAPGIKKLLLILVITLLAGNFLQAQDEIFPFVEGGKIGYKDVEGRIVLQPQFDYAEEFRPDFPWTVVGKGSYELLNHNMDSREVNFYGKFGLISAGGEIIFEPLFSLIFEPGKETAVVGDGNGYIHFEAFPAEKNYVFDGEMGVVGIRGDTIVPVQYISLKSLTADGDAYWFVKDEDSAFLYNRASGHYVPGTIESIDDFSDGLARIKTPSGFGFVDTAGRITIEPKYNKASGFNMGTALVKKDNRYFFIDVQGEQKETAKFQFNEISPLSEGLARVRIFDEYGYIYPDSTFFIVPEFTEAGNFFNGIAPVSTVDSFGYIHTDGSRDLVRKYRESPVDANELRNTRPDVLDSARSIPCGCVDSVFFEVSIDTLDLASYFTLHLEALRWGPYSYYRYPQMLDKVSAGEGTLAGRYDFNFGFMKPGNQAWESFRKEVLFPLIRNSQLYSQVWEWVTPVLKQVYSSMPEKHRGIYLRMVNYLVRYFEDYPEEKVQQFLKNFPDEFAYRHWDGSQSPFRKVSALLERLIFIHKVLNLEDLQFWLRKADMEIETWQVGS
jgi:hypothetical protein